MSNAKVPKTYMDTVVSELAKSRAKKKLDPVGDCVVFRFVEPHLSDAGIFLGTVEEKKRAIVVAVGPGKLMPDGSRRPMHVKPGDQILPWKEASTRIGSVDVTGETLCMVHEEDIACLVVEDGPHLEAS